MSAMTAQTDSTSGDIQLHLCQRCGISIPEADIENGRARAAPGGYVCVGCIYKKRDQEIAPVAASGPRAVTAQAQAQARSGVGLRILGSVAMLYVVGVTTFLLFRELNPTPVDLELPSIASARDVKGLGRKLDAVDEQTRGALAQLKSNDQKQNDDLAQVSRRVQGVEKWLVDDAEETRRRHDDLVRSLIKLREQTLGLDKDVNTVLREVRGLDDKMKAGGDAPGPEKPPVAPEPKDTPKPRVDPNPELTRQLSNFVRQLKDRSIDDQTRFNAAVQLGDLRDPRAVDPLVEALHKDSYDLVRRASAWSLGMLGKDAVRAIPDLIDQMKDKEEYVGYMCERALGEITKAALGEPVSFKFDPTMKSRERRRVQKKWEAWWIKNKPMLLPGDS